MSWMPAWVQTALRSVAAAVMVMRCASLGCASLVAQQPAGVLEDDSGTLDAGDELVELAVDGRCAVVDCSHRTVCRRAAELVGRDGVLRDQRQVVADGHVVG